MALSMYLSVSVFVLYLSVCCWPMMEVSAVSAAAARLSVMGDVDDADDGVSGGGGGGGGGNGDGVDDAQMMAELRRQDLQDLNRATQEDDRPLLPNPLPPSLLLQILRKEEAALQQQTQQQEQQQQQKQHQDNTSNNDKDDEAELNDNEENKVQKRVFCNSFTGCGGIHRRRNRRRLYGKRKLPALVKRLFCTSFGCFKAQPKTPSAQVVPRARFLPARGYIRMGVRQGGKQKGQKVGEMEKRKGGGGGVVEKRLFCNGYGGCRGGKRSLFSPWMTKMNSVADSSR